MIKIFDKVIRDQLGGDLLPNDWPLCYLKFSTVTSGSGLYDKVIFLVFKNQESSPFLCLKTVRSYAAKAAVVRNFENLKKLNNLTKGSFHAELFARAIYLHDDSENIFSIETACLGEKVKLNKEILDRVVHDYVAFQKYLEKSGEKTMRNFGQLTSEVIVKSGLSESDQFKICEYSTKLPLTNLCLPKIIQHGDLTLDNLLFYEGQVRVVDYDFVGSSDIPGFDLFGLFRRLSQFDLLELCHKYFPAYFEKIGGEFEGNNYRGLMFLYHLVEHTQGILSQSRTISSEQIISDFEQLYSKQ